MKLIREWKRQRPIGDWRIQSPIKDWWLLVSCLLLSSTISFSQTKKSINTKTETPTQGFALIELFTSDGKETCPPADELIKKLLADAQKNKRPVYAISYHVDYWNKLGWKDPYGKLQFSNKQKDYMFKLNLPEMYTPMMIVNGTDAFVGSDEKLAKAAIEKNIKQPIAVSLDLIKDSVSRDTLFMHYTSSKADKNFYLRIAITENNLTSAPNAGENKGKQLYFQNVVRLFYSTGLNDKNGVVKIPLKKFIPNKNCSIVSFVQHKQTSKVLGIIQKPF